jgi:N-acetyltransferase
VIFPKDREDYMMKFEPVTLQGSYVRLAPFNDIYVDQLAKTGSSQMMYYTYGPQEWTSSGIRTYIAQRFTGLSDRIPLVIIRQATNEVIGFTAFINIKREDSRLEIGPIWIMETEQGSPAFTESMYMMLKHAFEIQVVRRVDFTCDSQNLRSKMALLKIGVTKEGTIRKDTLRTDKSVRDTIIFGIIDTDWSEICQRLQLHLYSNQYPSLPNSDCIRIRPAKLDDIESLVEVEKSAFGQGYSFSNFRQYYDLFADLLYLAETDNAKVVGYVLAGITSQDRRIGWILSIGIKSEYQTKGIGKQLMSTIHTQLCAYNCQKFLLTVHPDRTYAIQFYEKIGYTKEQLYPDYFGSGSPRYLMQFLR